MSKNIVLISGSPRRNGNTQRLTQEFVKGALEAGNTVEIIRAADKKIAACCGCNYCYKDPAHRCAVKDDMQECYEKLAAADVIVVAVPVYFYSVSAQIKCLIDRLHNPVRNTFKVRKLALLSVCADDSDSVFDSIRVMYRSVLSYFSLEDGGMVTVHGVQNIGDIEGNPLLADAYKLGLNI
ncbi:MAG: flavodoxin family protein [Oscillospiraceae bacterium]|nr:flavodoxin family protein [Oscillospiraceae bacterium]